MIKVTKAFVGAIKKVAPHLLPDNAAQSATNCDLDNGALRALNDVSPSATLGKAGAKQALYRFADTYWFHWLAAVDVVKGPIAGDTTERTYFTGDGVPQFTYAGVATSGGDNMYPSVSYVLGVPIPVATPSAAIYDGTASEDIADLRDRAYVYTWVNSLGEESAPSSVSGTVTVSGTQRVNVTNLETTPTGSYVAFAGKRIYRADTDGAYRYVAQVAVGTVSYIDEITDAALGEEIVTATWLPPAADLAGLISLPNGSLVAFTGKTVCLSVENQPHAWPVAGEYTIHDDIVAIGAFGTSILALTDSYPVVLSGMSYDAMSVERVEVSEACTVKRGAVDVGYSVAYPSPDGLVLVGMQTAANITEKTLDRDQWEALSTGLVFAVGSVNKYYGFTSTGGFIVNLSTGDIVEHEITADAGYFDAPSGDIYLVQGDIVKLWDGGSALTYVWKSKRFYDTKPTNYGFGQAYAASYPVTMRIYADALLKHTQTVRDENPFRLPGGFLATRWEYELEGSADLYQAAIASSIQELMSV